MKTFWELREVSSSLAKRAFDARAKKYNKASNSASGWDKAADRAKGTERSDRLRHAADNQKRAKDMEKKMDRSARKGGFDAQDRYKKVSNESATEQIVAEISNKTLDAYRKKAVKSYNKSIDYFDSPSHEKRPETKAKHQRNLDKRGKGIDSTYKRDMAGKRQRFIHKPTRHDDIESGKRGLTNKPASKLAKAYKDR